MGFSFRRHPPRRAVSRIVSTSSTAVRVSAGRTADGDFDALALTSRGSDLAITGCRCRAFRLFV
jgi:hypothetical protein